MDKKPNVGGQAVIEGVMMRGAAGDIAVAVRQPNGEIIVDKMASSSIAEKYPVFKKPFLRGVVVLCVITSYSIHYTKLYDGDPGVPRNQDVLEAAHQRSPSHTVLTSVYRPSAVCGSDSAAARPSWYFALPTL